MTLTRRALLGGAGAFSTQVLLSSRLLGSTGAFVPISGGPAAEPGALNLTLSALTPQILHISISPANDSPRLGELGVVDKPGTPLGGPGPVHRGTVAWGKYSVKVTDGPLHVAAYE